MAYLKALLIGSVRDYGDENSNDALFRPWKTAMFKVSQDDEIFANELGFVGDNVADIKHHGGVEKAVFANSYENYPSWQKYLGLGNLPFGAMGENLTISGLHEDDVCIGDIHKIGSLVLQVSQPRKPCFKLSKRWMNRELANEIFKTGLTGWYYRVLEKGACKVKDEVNVVLKDNIQMSISQVNSLFYSPKENLNLVDKFFKLETITKSWKDDMVRRVEGRYNTDYMEKL